MKPVHFVLGMKYPIFFSFLVLGGLVALLYYMRPKARHYAERKMCKTMEVSKVEMGDCIEIQRFILKYGA